MITVRLPSTLRVGSSDTIEIQEPVATIAQLVDVLDRRIPGFRDQLDDSVFNFAVNDEMLLHRARERALREGDVVEVVPTISGGSALTRARWQPSRRPAGSPRERLRCSKNQGRTW
jgi:molybdopterin converting factor small subunit